VFDFILSDADMAELDALDEGTHYAWDPTPVP
jgi:diketogulonate reductase-like aldo/keto reductase